MRIDRLAEAIHADYQDKHKGKEEKAVEWEKLTEEDREANRQQADHIAVKVRAAGGAWKAGLSLSEDDCQKLLANRERLARMEHNRWCAGKRLAGFTYSEKMDRNRRRHANLVPWEQLSKADREKDGNTVNNIDNLLKITDTKA